MATHQTWGKFQEIPLGSGCFQYRLGIDLQQPKYFGELVHKRNVNVALGVFDHFGRFGHFDGRAKWVPAVMTEA